MFKMFTQVVRVCLIPLRKHFFIFFCFETSHYHRSSRQISNNGVRKPVGSCSGFKMEWMTYIANKTVNVLHKIGVHINVHCQFCYLYIIVIVLY